MKERLPGCSKNSTREEDWLQAIVEPKETTPILYPCEKLPDIHTKGIYPPDHFKNSKWVPLVLQNLVLKPTSASTMTFASLLRGSRRAAMRHVHGPRRQKMSKALGQSPAEDVWRENASKGLLPKKKSTLDPKPRS